MNLSQRVLGDKLKPLPVRLIDKIASKIERYPIIKMYSLLLAIFLGVCFFSLWLSDSLPNAILMAAAIIGAIKIIGDLLKDAKERFREE